jgi:hypothetical protein
MPCSGLMPSSPWRGKSKIIQVAHGAPLAARVWTAPLFSWDAKGKDLSSPPTGESFEERLGEELTSRRAGFVQTLVRSHSSINGEATMAEHGTLLYSDEAMRFIEQIQDSVTKNLVNMAFVHLVKRSHLEKRDFPRCDLDMLYVVTALKDFFSEHSVIARTLEGEKVGTWFEG